MFFHGPNVLMEFAIQIIQLKDNISKWYQLFHLKLTRLQFFGAWNQHCQSYDLRSGNWLVYDLEFKVTEKAFKSWMKNTESIHCDSHIIHGYSRLTAPGQFKANSLSYRIFLHIFSPFIYNTLVPARLNILRSYFALSSFMHGKNLSSGMHPFLLNKLTLEHNFIY